VGSNGISFERRFIKICLLVQKIIVGKLYRQRHTHIHKEHGEIIQTQTYKDGMLNLYTNSMVKSYRHRQTHTQIVC